MRYSTRLLALLVGSALLATCSSGRGTVEPGGFEPEPSLTESRATIWDRVYTAEQAARGERTAWTNCFSCHSAGEWGNAAFMRSSSGRLGDLFNTISRSMPYDTPGSLSAGEYADIVAYMLELQEAPAGEIELPSDLDALDRIAITPPGGE